MLLAAVIASLVNGEQPRWPLFIAADLCFALAGAVGARMCVTGLSRVAQLWLARTAVADEALANIVDATIHCHPRFWDHVADNSRSTPMTRKRKDDGDYQDEPPREPHREGENAVKVHEAYLTHRLGGGEPATPKPTAGRSSSSSSCRSRALVPDVVRPAEPEKLEKPADPPKPGEDEGEPA